jgi:hypothetical protein
MEHLLPIGLAVLAGAALQSATGFGFALVCAPVAFALLDPEPAIWLLALLGALVNVLTLATEGRRPAPLGADAAALLAWTVPGAVAGALLLQTLDELALQALVTLAVLGSLLSRRLRPRTGPVAAWARPAAGVASGALNTSTGTGGPPLVLFLLHRGAPPERVRDTLTTVFLASGAVTVAVLVLTGVRTLPEPELLAACVPIALAGHVAGRRVFRRLAGGGYEAALVLVLLASAAGGLLRALG